MYGGKYEKNAVYFFTRFTSIITRSPKTADSSIEWTADELLFIANHSEVKVGVDLKFVPFEFIDIDEKYKGVASDYIAIIEQKIEIDFVITPNLSWTEAYDLAKAGEIDVLPAISKTTEREEFFLFSESYYQFKRVIVTQNTETSIGGIDDLEGLTVAVQKNSSHHSYLLSFSTINLVLYDTVEEALIAVANGTSICWKSCNHKLFDSGISFNKSQVCCL